MGENNIFKEKLQNIYYWFKHRFIVKYHIIKLNLKPGYYDYDVRLEEGLISIFNEYYENNKDCIERDNSLYLLCSRYNVENSWKAFYDFMRDMKNYLDQRDLWMNEIDELDLRDSYYFEKLVKMRRGLWD